MTRRISPTSKALTDRFQSGYKGRKPLQIGMEVEHLCVNQHDGMRLPYLGATCSVVSVLKSLLRARAGKPISENGKLIGIQSKNGTVTLEPGGQIEWSSPVCRNLHELSEQLDRWLSDFRFALKQNQATTIDTGLDVGTSVDDIPWVSKERYRLMRAYYSNCPDIKHVAMANTASIHVALDYRHEIDWQQKFRAMLLLTPIVTAVFGNSPAQINGSDYHAWRPALWSMIDPARCEPPPVAFNPAFAVSDWANWIAAVPESLRLEDDRLIIGDATEFHRKNTTEDKALALHLSTIFTPVRTNRYLEVRTADMQCDEDLFAVPAFWHGLLYSGEHLAQALRSLAFIADVRDWKRLNVLSCRFGLKHDLLRSVARQMVQLALDGLRTSPDDNEKAILSLTQLASRVFVGADAEARDTTTNLSDLPRNHLALHFEKLKSDGR